MANVQKSVYSIHYTAWEALQWVVTERESSLGSLLILMMCIRLYVFIGNNEQRFRSVVVEKVIDSLVHRVGAVNM